MVKKKARETAEQHEEAQKIDNHVGRRLRARRQELGMSQTAVAEKLDVTFQQVQKYERGMNRISASRLHDLCGILQVGIEYFFDGLGGSVVHEPEDEFLEDPELLELVKAHQDISPQTRSRLGGLIRAVARDSTAT